MQLYPRRQNVAAQVVEELKTVTYATPSYGGTQKERKKTFSTFNSIKNTLMSVKIKIK